MTETSDREACLKMYELYVRRISEEGDWYRSRFRIYLSLNAGLLLAFIFLFKEELKAFELVPLTTAILMAILGIVGFYLSKAWRVVARDGAGWQRFIHERLAKIEAALQLEAVTLFRDIVTESGTGNYPRGDVMAVNRKVAALFAWVWLFLTAMAAGVLFFKLI
jgi:hypothetical protein